MTELRIGIQQRPVIENPAQQGTIKTERFFSRPAVARSGFHQAPAPQPVRTSQNCAYKRRIAQQRADQPQCRVPAAVVIIEIAERALETHVELGRETKQKSLALKFGER